MPKGWSRYTRTAWATLLLVCASKLWCQQPVAPATDETAIPFVVSEELPVADRQWESLAFLRTDVNAAVPASGVSGDAESDLANGRDGGAVAQARSGLSFSGLPASQRLELLDGLSLQQNFRSSPRGTMAASARDYNASYAQTAVRNFRVLPGTYSAEFGGAAGGLLAITSQAGTETSHGSLLALLRQSALAAANPYSVATQYQNGVITNSLVKPSDTLVQLAAHVGFQLTALLARFKKPVRGTTVMQSPLLKNLGIFLSLEGQWRDDEAIASPADTNFYALTSTQLGLLGTRGVSDAARNAALNYLDSLTGAITRSDSRLLGFARVDERLSRRDRLAFMLTHNRFDSPAGVSSSSASEAVVADGRESVGDAVSHVDALASIWTHAFTQTLEHELRFQLAHDLEYDTPRVPLAQEPEIAAGGFAPQVRIAPDGFTYGTPANLGRLAYPDEWRVQLANTLGWLHGRHFIRLGGDWSRIVDRIASTPNPDGSFLYDTGVTKGNAGGLVDWITDYTFNVNAYPNGGCPSINAAVHDFCFRSFTQSFGQAQTEFVTHDVAGFVEDAIQLRQHLRVSIGARYEYTLLPLPQTPNLVLDEDLKALATQVHGATATFPEDRNNVGPRVSAAWMPRAWFTAHLGYGIFYGRLVGTTVRSALADTALQATTLSIRIRPTTETNCPQVTVGNQGFGYPCTFTSAPPGAVAATSSAMLFAANFRLPTVQRATLSLERDLGRHVWLRAGYAMALTTQLPGSVDLNIAPATTLTTFMLQGGDGHKGLASGETFAVPLYTARRLTQYGPVTALVSSANATYHSVTVETAARGWKAFELRAGFTFSRAIDYAPQLSATPESDGQFDPFQHGYDKGLSTLHFPERFSGQAIYRARLQRGAKWIQRGVDGWRVASIAVAGSGAPYSYEIFGGTYLTGGNETINGSGGATYLPTVGRNTLRLPARASVDLRLEREFSLRKSLRLSGFAEAFNLLNERNLSKVETRAFLVGTPATSGAPTPLVFQDTAAIANEKITTPSFGAATSSTTGVSRERQIEVGVRLMF